MIGLEGGEKILDKTNEMWPYNTKYESYSMMDFLNSKDGIKSIGIEDIKNDGVSEYAVISSKGITLKLKSNKDSVIQFNYLLYSWNKDVSAEIIANGNIVERHVFKAGQFDNVRSIKFKSMGETFELTVRCSPFCPDTSRLYRSSMDILDVTSKNSTVPILFNLKWIDVSNQNAYFNLSGFSDIYFREGIPFTLLKNGESEIINKQSINPIVSAFQFESNQDFVIKLKRDGFNFGGGSGGLNRGFSLMSTINKGKGAIKIEAKCLKASVDCVRAYRPSLLVAPIPGFADYAVSILLLLGLILLLRRLIFGRRFIK